ncbi:hypothetical protein NCS56_00897500 [Fusarium sp. Ph1]|nr:hypothetical protein NCS56_00897500 [Fusarium sp. Ph1]
MGDDPSSTAMLSVERPPEAPPDAASSLVKAPQTGTRKRQRKWHSRVFTGCLNCRRRHVRCDEQTPSCASCSRLSLSCAYDSDNRFGKFVFRVVRPPRDCGQPVARPSLPSTEELQYARTPRRASSDNNLDQGASRFGDEASSGPATPVSTSPQHDNPPNTEGEVDSGLVVGSDHLAWLDDILHLWEPQWPSSFSDMFSMPSPTATSLIPQQAVYYNHFLTDVATILIVFDTESNANPYRIFPQLAGASNLLQDTMVALGAMHLANLPGTRDKAVHYRAAMEVYGSVMTRLGDVLHGQPCFELEPLATSLLLCMFETMYSTDCTWKVHLAGAGRILEAIYSPALLGMTGRGQHGCSADGSGPDLVRPMRRFLASLLAYLDVAGACATGEGTVIQGDYWETLGGGWEYNLGAPSFHPCRTPADRTLAQIRHSWSRLMSVQAAISAFAKMQSSGSLDVSQEDMMRDDLAYRISNWHNSTPDIFLYLSKDGGRQSTPMDHSESHNELLAAAACVECYAMACRVYLDRVATQKLSRAAQDPTIAAVTSRILTLTSTFSSGLTRLGYLWSVFTAGTATIEEGERASVREFLTDMKNFGFKHVTRALDMLEYVWLQYRLFGEADYNAFQKLAATVLLP